MQGGPSGEVDNRKGRCAEQARVNRLDDYACATNTRNLVVSPGERCLLLAGTYDFDTLTIMKGASVRVVYEAFPCPPPPPPTPSPVVIPRNLTSTVLVSAQIPTPSPTPLAPAIYATSDRLVITAQTVRIETGATLTMNGMIVVPGAGTSTTLEVGASHGGIGGYAAGVGAPAGVYGSVLAPAALGSPGGVNGTGGMVSITASSMIYIDGTVSVNGGAGAGGRSGGSGGSLNLVAPTFTAMVLWRQLAARRRLARVAAGLVGALR